jgi:hypothetical protein
MLVCSVVGLATSTLHSPSWLDFAGSERFEMWRDRLKTAIQEHVVPVVAVLLERRPDTTGQPRHISPYNPSLPCRLQLP